MHINREICILEGFRFSQSTYNKLKFRSALFFFCQPLTIWLNWHIHAGAFKNQRESFGFKPLSIVNVSEANQICWDFIGGILYTPKGDCGVNWTDLFLVSQNIDIKAGKKSVWFSSWGGFTLTFNIESEGLMNPEIQSERGVWVHTKTKRLLWMEAEFQLSSLSAYTIC